MLRNFVAGIVIFATIAVGAAYAAGPPLSADQLVTRADAVCARYAARLGSPGAQTELGKPAWDRAWLRTFNRQRAELAALVPPRSHAARWSLFLESLPPMRDAFRALTTALERKQPVRKWAPLVRKLKLAEQQAGKRGRQVGLTRCFVVKSGDGSHGGGNKPPKKPKPPADDKGSPPPDDPGNSKGKGK
jgi:hypothetical protein